MPIDWIDNAGTNIHSLTNMGLFVCLDMRKVCSECLVINSQISGGIVTRLIIHPEIRKSISEVCSRYLHNESPMKHNVGKLASAW